MDKRLKVLHLNPSSFDINTLQLRIAYELKKKLITSIMLILSSIYHSFFMPKYKKMLYWPIKYLSIVLYQQHPITNILLLFCESYYILNKMLCNILPKILNMF